MSTSPATRFLELLRADGPGAALRAARSHLRNYLFALTYCRAVFAARFDPDRAHPWETIWIDPTDVEWSYKRTAAHGAGGAVVDFDEIEDAGRVVGGDWDRRVRVRYGDLPKVEAVRERFEEGVPWEETAAFEQLAALIEERGAFDGCENRSELRDRYRRIDRLYETIAEEGYRPRADLCHPLDFRYRLDVPKVHVGRDGTLIHAGGSGNHRLAIGRVLDVPVEARVVVRHAEWERLREEIRAADSREELSERARDALSHPDVDGLEP